ncbi:MAG TPA: 1-deoxy-D-xylulose-5-phosphate synthase, partial [Clostridiales bacterium]|nr:1-deoxy-D-xylulose-5-phosphate synthase [Clostridiales bacterium]
KPLYRAIQLLKRLTRQLLIGHGVLFEQLGFRYYGPVDGHDLPSLQNHLQAVQRIQGPILLHVLTQKGRGYRYAEESPDLYHGVAPFVVENGIAGHNGAAAPVGRQEECASISQAFGSRLVELAAHNPRICAISAAMTVGTGLTGFAEAFPQRFFDVGIAEQHAVTLAAGLAAGGLRPVVALYSTFLQRALDQLLHDICLQNLPVVLAIDRAGVVGEDGETHQGIYDLGFLMSLPALEIFCPISCDNLTEILDYAIKADHPVAIRYPRGKSWPRQLTAVTTGSAKPASATDFERIRRLRQGHHITIAALGSMAGPALAAADLLAEQGITADVLAVICAKPLDFETLRDSVSQTGHVLFVEEALIEGGFGQHALPDLLADLPAMHFRLAGISSQLLCQGTRDQLLSEQKLMPADLAQLAINMLKNN